MVLEEGWACRGFGHDRRRSLRALIVFDSVENKVGSMTNVRVLWLTDSIRFPSYTIRDASAANAANTLNLGQKDCRSSGPRGVGFPLPVY